MIKILLVDDDRDFTDLTRIALMEQKYHVSVFHSALKALEYMKLNKPDLILMDIMMPDLNGAETVKILQQHLDFKDIPVIFLTGLISNKEKELEESGIHIEGAIYKTLGKPYEIDELLKTVKNILLETSRIK